MTTRSTSILAILALALAGAGCVTGEGDPATGNAQILPGGPAAVADYDQSMTGAAGAAADPFAGQAGGGVTTPPAAGAAGGAPAPTAGAGGAEPPATAGVGGAPTEPIAGADPTTPVAGTSGAGTAGAGGEAGAAGADPNTPIAGTSGGGATEPTEPAPSGNAGTLTLQFTTKTQGGRYAPRNYGAVWIETGSGMFVKTLKRWAGIHVGDLRAWSAASGGWGFFGIGGNAADQVDVISQATLRSHETHNLTWNMIDNNMQVVPDGGYKVAIEIADGSTGVTRVDFQKGAAPADVSLPSDTTVVDFSLNYTP